MIAAASRVSIAWLCMGSPCVGLVAGPDTLQVTGRGAVRNSPADYFIVQDRRPKGRPRVARRTFLGARPGRSRPSRVAVLRAFHAGCSVSARSIRAYRCPPVACASLNTREPVAQQWPGPLHK